MKINNVSNVIAIIILVAPLVSLSTPAIVHDPAVHAQNVTLTNHIIDGIRKTEEMTNSMNRQNRMLGTYTNFDVTNGATRELSRSVRGWTSPTRSLMFALQGVSRDPTNIRRWKNLDYAKDRITKKFMPEKTRDNKITMKEANRVVANRRQATTESARTSLAVAESKQASVDEVQEKIVDISTRSATTENLYETGKINNETGVVIANELVQIRLLLAKLVELESTRVLKESFEWSQTPPYHIPQSLINRSKNQPTRAEILGLTDQNTNGSNN